jgi:hypothetical protein
MARIDEDPDERDTAPLTLTQVLDCPECDTPFDHVFTAPPGVFYSEDLEDPPTETVTCPNPECNHSWEETYSGWTAHSDAG